VRDVTVAQSGGSAKRNLKEERLNRASSIQGGKSQTTLRRTDLPAIVRHIPEDPPHDFPAYSPDRPETDFQLQQALVLARAMATEQASPLH
jgi:carboxyl-terminal processing protease